MQYRVRCQLQYNGMQALRLRRCCRSVQGISFFSDKSFMEYSRQWLDCHLEVAELYGKPLLLGEFGDSNSTALRATFFDSVRQMGLAPTPHHRIRPSHIPLKPPAH